MSRTFITIRIVEGFLCQIDGFLGNSDFGHVTSFRHFFDLVTVMVAGSKIHLWIDLCRIRAQNLFDDREGFDEFMPVHRTEQPDAADAVTDTDLIGCLPLGFEHDELFDRQAGFGKTL